MNGNHTKYPPKYQPVSHEVIKTPVLSKWVTLLVNTIDPVLIAIDAINVSMAPISFPFNLVTNSPNVWASAVVKLRTINEDIKFFTFSRLAVTDWDLYAPSNSSAAFIVVVYKIAFSSFNSVIFSFARDFPRYKSIRKSVSAITFTV